MGIERQKRLLEREGHTIINKGKRIFVKDFEKKPNMLTSVLTECVHITTIAVRSLTLVPVGPVKIRSSSFEKNPYESLFVKNSLASSPLS